MDKKKGEEWERELEGKGKWFMVKVSGGWRRVRGIRVRNDEGSGSMGYSAGRMTKEGVLFEK